MSLRPAPPVKYRSGSAGGPSSARWRSMALEIEAIILADSTGYLPTAVSSESITASVPSRMAFATSATSARLGRTFSVME